MFFLLIAFALMPFASSSRISGKQQVTCEITGPKGESVIFPVQKCHTQCVKATSWEGSRMGGNTEKQFSLLFDVSYKTRSCICSIGSNPVVQFGAHKNSKQAENCKNNANEAKIDCWELYKKGRATHIELEPTSNGGKVAIAYHRPGEYAEAHFHVNKTCNPCIGKDCHSTAVPSLLAGLSHDVQRAVGEALTDVSKGGKGGKGDPALKDFGALLVDKDRDQLLFNEIDVDGDGHLDVDELAGHYSDFTKTHLEDLIKQVDADNSGDITLNEFQALQELIRVDRIEDELEFDRIDKNGDGLLSAYELTRHYSDKGWTNCQIKYIIQQIHPLVPGKVTKDEFKQFKDVMNEYMESGEVRFPKDIEFDDCDDEDDDEHEDEDDHNAVPAAMPTDPTRPIRPIEPSGHDQPGIGPEGPVRRTSSTRPEGPVRRPLPEERADVDKIESGSEDEELLVDGQRDGKAKWHAKVVITCEKDGVEVDESECDGESVRAAKREAVRAALHL